MFWLEMKKEIKELEEKLQKEQKKYSDLQEKMWELLETERHRIDNLVHDIETRFSQYMEEYSKANAILTKHRQPPIFRVYTETDMARPIEYGEIRIPELHIKFVKGEKDG